MEDKFRLLRMTEVLKTKYAAHQLQGPAGIWWRHHRATFPAIDQITWNEFTEAVRGVYIPFGLIEMKLQEFLALTQGTKTVTQYLHAFNNLCRYAPDMVGTDIKKIASFKRGLNTKMLKHVGTSARAVFNEFISDCLKQEKNNDVHSAFKARKRVLDSSTSQARAPMQRRSPYHSPVSEVKFKPPQRMILTKKKPSQTSQGSSTGPKISVVGPCHNCHQHGHLIKHCPYPKQRVVYPGRVHYTTAEEIPEGEPVTAGRFPVNQHPAIVLFDSGSSHSFMSQEFAQKHHQKNR
jgi:hypothetical protein